MSRKDGLEDPLIKGSFIGECVADGEADFAEETGEEVGGKELVIFGENGLHPVFPGCCGDIAYASGERKPVSVREVGDMVPDVIGEFAGAIL